MSWWTYYEHHLIPVLFYSVSRCTDSTGRMTLSVKVREPGYHHGRSDIGEWTCYLVTGVAQLTNNFNVDWLGIKS